MLANLRYAIRVLWKSPAFTIVSILTLALGIGANTAIFSVVYSAILRPLPYREAGRLLTLGEARSSGVVATQNSYPDYLDWKRTAKSFESLCAFGGDAFTISISGDPKSTQAAQVTAEFFSTLGVKPALGRDFQASDQQGEYPVVAMLSNEFWRSDFNSDPNAVGRVIQLDSRPVTIVGVLPRNFEFAPAQSAPLWVPLHPNNDLKTRRNLRWVQVIGRLRPGISFTQAQAEMRGITAQLAAAYPKENGAVVLNMQMLRDRIVGRIQPLMLVLLGAVGFVLLITCANVANLLMTRSLGRRKEFAVRAALGASRGNLLGQLLSESLLLSFAGAVAGLAAANWGVDLLIAAIPQTQLQAMPYLRDAGINLPVLLFLGGVTILIGILFGLTPGFAAGRTPLNDALKDETRGGTGGAGQGRFRNALVTAEIAISLVLLIGAALMLQSLQALLHQDPGMSTRNVLTFSVNLPDLTYPSDKAYPNNSLTALRFEHEFIGKLRAIPGVEDAATATGIPATGGAGSIRFLVEGRPKALGQEDESDILTVDSSYFSTLKIPLRSGRVFDSSDAMEAPETAVINRSFAKAYFPNEDPVGKRVKFTFDKREPYRRIIGVVGDTAEDDLAAPPPEIVYLPNDQSTSTFLNFLVRTSGDPAAFVGAVRNALREMDPRLPMIRPQSLDQVAQQSPSVFLRRYPSYLIGSFAVLALTLAMVGLYGLISYGMVQRTREIGIRVTLGAQGADIARLVLRQGMLFSIAGVALGVVAALMLTRLLSGLLYGVKAADGWTFTAVSGAMLLVSAIACLIPARRATQVDPMVAMRQQ